MKKKTLTDPENEINFLGSYYSKINKKPIPKKFNDKNEHCIVLKEEKNILMLNYSLRITIKLNKYEIWKNE